MKPEELSGRSLDAAVAEEVMGWMPPAPGEKRWTSPSRKACSNTCIPRYSFWDMARLVVEKIESEGAMIVIRTNSFIGGPPEGYEACFFTEYGYEWDVKRDERTVDASIGKTVPEAICRAALAWARGRKG